MRALTYSLVGTLCGCAFSLEGPPVPCAVDSDCSAPEICFAGACGSPDKGIFAEITANASAGAQAQDFAVGSLQANESFALAGPAIVEGEIFQGDPDAGVGALPAFAGSVIFQATGFSALIPGESRSYQSSQDLSTVNGVFELRVGTGVYDLTVTPTGSLWSWIPPQVVHQVAMGAGSHVLEQIVLPSNAANAVPGPALTSASYVYFLASVSSAGTTPSSGYEVQVFDPQSGDPLSQSTQVVSGGFKICINVGAMTSTTLLIKAVPTPDPTVAPTKTFSFDLTSFAPDAGVPSFQMDLGAYGALVPVSGTVMTAAGAAVPGAQVFVSGLVQGGGAYQSATVQTQADGTFTVQSLASAKDGSGALALSVLPPAGSVSGIAQGTVAISATGAQVGVITCPQRLVVNGNLQGPDGTPAANANLTLVPVNPLTGTVAPPPAMQFTTTTDNTGAFSLPVDPAFYRLDFVPADASLPRASWFQNLLTAAIGPDGGSQTSVSLPEYQLSQGSTVTGTITIPTGINEQADMVPAPFATIRFFRVAPVGGTAVAYPLAETDADASGNYSVVLPTR